MPTNVLLVEDNPGDARLIRESLADVPGAPFSLVHADRLSSALDRLTENHVDAVLLDLSLPDSEGLETLVGLRQREPRVPVVVLTGADDDQLASAAIRRGAQDYLVKGRVDSELLHRTLRYAIERKHGQEQLLRQQQELAVAEERSRLAREIHDALAQSFIVIALQIDLAEGMLEADPAAARRELDRARKLAREGLEEARNSILALRPSVVERVALGEALAHALETLLGEDVAVRVSVSGHPAPLHSDTQAALYRIAQEAAANIRKHAGATEVAALLDYGGDALTLTIADNGNGFDVARARGAGVGLASMRERALLLGGDVRLESAPGRGVRIIVRVPLRGVECSTPVRPEPVAESRGIRVLVADDHVATREGLRRILERAPDIEVVAEAGSGTEALAAARACRPDVVVTDVRMPDMGGIDLLGALKAEGLTTQAVVLTAFVEGELVRAALKAGAHAFLPKHASVTDLLRAVRAVSRGETVLPADVAAEMGRSVRDAGETGLIEDLSPREREILALIIRGMSNKEIAAEVRLTEATVKFHVTHIFEKLGVRSRTQAVGRARQLGLDSLP